MPPLSGNTFAFFLFFTLNVNQSQPPIFRYLSVRKFSFLHIGTQGAVLFDRFPVKFTVQLQRKSILLFRIAVRDQTVKRHAIVLRVC